MGNHGRLNAYSPSKETMTQAELAFDEALKGWPELDKLDSVRAFLLEQRALADVLANDDAAHAQYLKRPQAMEMWTWLSSDGPKDLAQKLKAHPAMVEAVPLRSKGDELLTQVQIGRALDVEALRKRSGELIADKERVARVTIRALIKPGSLEAARDLALVEELR